jgi:hypothetical protein
MAHGCASSAWTLGFYTLHNWMLALFCEQAQDEVFVDGPVSARPRRIVHESRSVIADLLEAAGASAQFLDNPLQGAKRDVDVIAGHVVFDYDVSRELAVALEIGAKVSPLAMV